MGIWLMIGAANLAVGALVGLCGVAGFLLPMFYTAGLGMSASEGLALSFAAFIVSGALGSFNYKKAGNLDVVFGSKLSIGSLAGAILGVKLNLVIPEEQVKMILYLVVLLSGISILLRKEKQPGKFKSRQSAGEISMERSAGTKTAEKEHRFSIEKNLPLTLALGFLTGLICSMSGAGGPVLVMPLLVVFGIPIRTAVGVALFNSVFIGIPAVIGYLGQCDMGKILPILIAALVTHGIGVFYGSKNASRINQGILKKGIAVFSIAIAVWKLGGIF